MKHIVHMDYDELIRIANFHYAKDRYLPAFNSYLNAAKVKPSKDLIDRLSFIFKRITDAHLDYAPISSKDYRYRAIAYAYNKDYEAAIRDCRSASKLEPQETKNYTLEAECHRNLRAYQKAIDALQTAIGIDGKGDHYYRLSIIASELDDYRSAEHCILYAIDDDNNKAEYRLQYGKILMAKNKYEDASRELYFAIELNDSLLNEVDPLAIECLSKLDIANK